MENALHMFGDGTWNDIIDSPSQTMGYFIEYSGPGFVTGSLAGNAADPESGPLTFAQTSSVAGLTIASDGSWTFDQGNAAYDYLAAGAEEDIIATFSVTDNQTAVTSGSLTLTLTGANNAAVIGGVTAASITEDSVPTVTGDLSHTDADTNNADDVWQVVTAGAATDNGYGTFEIDVDGQWTYTLDNANATVNALTGTGSLQDTFSVLTQDGTSQLVEVTINGANDKPVIVSDSSLTLNVRETGVDTVGILTDNAIMTVIDPDMTTGGTWSFQTLTINFFTSVSHSPTTGFWGYTLNDESFLVNQLGEGQTGTDSFSRTYTDEFGSVSDAVPMTVIVTGSNDAASISGVLGGLVTEDMGNDSVSGDASHTDIDLNNANDVWQAVSNGTATYGSFTVTTGGVWTYTLDDSNTAVNALNDGDTEFDSFTITTEDGTTQTISIDIIGNTDALPVVANDDSGFIETIDVLILGTDMTALTATGNQLNGSNDDRFNFNVTTLQIPAIFTAPQWQVKFEAADVVLLGGVDNTEQFDGNVMFEVLSSYYAAGGNVVTTGGVVQQLFDTSGATRAYLNDITPLGQQSGGTSIGTSIDMNGAVHPITDDIGNITNGFTNWFSSQYMDVGAVQLAYPSGGNMVPHSISYTEGTGGAGNTAFVGGGYLHSLLDTTSLRTGDADFVLEQALAWAAGVKKIDVNENEPFTFTDDSLLANDVDPNAMATITSVQTFSDKGATVTLSGGDVLYNPISSFGLNSLNDGETDTDTFTYTISDGVTTDTATVTVTVNGLTDMDQPPVVSDPEMNGFASPASDYRFGQRILDDDEFSGISHLLYDEGGLTNAPTGVSFSATFVDFSFTAAAETDYEAGYGIYAYEADGQSYSVNIGYSVDSSGDLRFFYTDYEQVYGGPVLEIAPDWIGDGGTVNLTGVDSIEQYAPGVLDNLSVLDIKNEQDEILDLDTAALLELVRGNGVTPESFVFQLDAGDSMNFLDDGEAPGSGWEAIETGVGSNTYNIYDTNVADGLFSDVSGPFFATIYIDGGGGAAPIE